MRGFETAPSPEPWPPIDLSRLLGERPALPALPLQALPERWAAWVADTAATTGTSVDSVVALLLAAVAGTCGARVAVRLAPGWEEPPILWQAVVAGPAADPSPALTVLRRVLAAVAHRVGPAGPWLVTEDRALPDLLAEADRHAAGALLCHAHPFAWFAALAEAPPRRGTRPRETLLPSWSPPRGESGPGRPAVSLLGRLEPARLAEALAGGDDGRTARLLCTWAAPPPWRSLLERPPLREAEAADALVRLVPVLGTRELPLVLPLLPDASALLDRHLARLHGEMIGTGDGLLAAWLANGPATVARLALVLALLRWTARPAATAAPTAVGAESVAGAVALWEAFRAHMAAVLDRGALDPHTVLRRRLIAWAAGRPRGAVQMAAQTAETPAGRDAGPADPVPAAPTDAAPAPAETAQTPPTAPPALVSMLTIDARNASGQPSPLPEPRGASP